MSEVEQVPPLGVVQAQCPGNALKHLRRGATDRTALKARVILHAQTGKGCHLATAQAIYTPGRMEAAAAAIPVGRTAQPEEIARWAWLLTGSGDAGFMTGETVTLSGGDVIR